MVRDKLQFLPILVWMEADRAVLEERVNRRIGQMIKEGGLEEALTLFDGLSEHNFEKGILQSIGYKEFYKIYQLGEAGKVLDFAVRGVPFEHSEVVKDGIRQLQAKTMQYAAY